MQKNYQELADHIAAGLGAAGLGDAILSTDVALGELTIEIVPAKLERVFFFLRDDESCQFKMLVDLCGVDYPEREKRFSVVYNFLSVALNQRCRVKLAVGEEEPVPSSVGIFSTAGWFEREAYDLYGIFFAGNPDLRRILTDYGFEGHPFRKDFPLSGYVEVRYDETEKRVIYEPVKLTQDFRSFDFLSPWEGMLHERRLPGDEKAAGETATESKKA